MEGSGAKNRRSGEGSCGGEGDVSETLSLGGRAEERGGGRPGGGRKGGEAEGEEKILFFGLRWIGVPNSSNSACDGGGV